VDERLGAIRSIRSGTIATNAPLSGGQSLRLAIEGRPQAAGEQPPRVTRVAIGPRYFDTMGLQLVRGRSFADSDGTAGHEAGIVNQRFVALFFANGGAIGRRVM